MTDEYGYDDAPTLDPNDLLAAVDQRLAAQQQQFLVQQSMAQYNVQKQLEAEALGKAVTARAQAEIPGFGDDEYREEVARVAAAWMPADGTEDDYVAALKRAAGLVNREKQDASARREQEQAEREWGAVRQAAREPNGRYW